jgi:hypothetical protein
MPKMTVVGVWPVEGSHVEDHTLNVPDPLDPAKVEKLLDAAVQGVSLCHECGHDVNNAMLGQLVSMTIGDVDYERHADGSWKVARS